MNALRGAVLACSVWGLLVLPSVAEACAVCTGGDSAPAAVGGAGVRKLVDTPWVERPTVRRVGRDIVLEGRLGDV